MKAYQVGVLSADGGLKQAVRLALPEDAFSVQDLPWEGLADALVSPPELAVVEAEPETLAFIKKVDPSISLVCVCPAERATEMLEAGAYACLTPPWVPSVLLERVERALAARQMVESIAICAPVLSVPGEELASRPAEPRSVFEIVYRLVSKDGPLLIQGESGTGKERVARALHYNCLRKEQKLLALHCSSIPEALFESELFEKDGRGGTLFLDEIGDLSLSLQGKLLNSMGGRLRVLAATNRNLEEWVQKSLFREDLYQKLKEVRISLVPLRERRDDIEKLARHFVQKFSKLHGKTVEGFQPAALQILLRHNWPGNIRELENVVEQAVVLEAQETITPASLPGYLVGEEFWGNRLVNPLVALELDETDGGGMNYKAHKEQFERDFIIRALKTFKGRINQTALHAQIPKKTLLRKLQKYQIRAEDYRA